MTIAAHVARGVLGLDVPAGLAGIAVATSTLGVGVVAALAVLALTKPLRRRLAAASDGRREIVDSAYTGAAALGVAVLLFAFGVATGSVSGEGGLWHLRHLQRSSSISAPPPSCSGFRDRAPSRPPSFDSIKRRARRRRRADPVRAHGARGARSQRQLDVAQAIERGAPLGKRPRRPPPRHRLRQRRRLGGLRRRRLQRRRLTSDRQRPRSDNGVDETAQARISRPRPSAPRSLRRPQKAPRRRPPRPPRAHPARLCPRIPQCCPDYDSHPPQRPWLRRQSEACLAYIRRARRLLTVFERAYSLASYTGKSVGPMLIGKYGSETHRNWGHFNKFSEEDTFVAERLKRAGVIATTSAHGHLVLRQIRRARSRALTRST